MSAYEELRRSIEITPKMANLLMMFARSVGLYDTRRLGRGVAMSGVALRKRGLLRSSWQNGKRQEWFLTPEGFSVGNALLKARAEDRQKEPLS